MDFETADPHVENQHRFGGVEHRRAGDAGVQADVALGTHHVEDDVLERVCGREDVQEHGNVDRQEREPEDEDDRRLDVLALGLFLVQLALAELQIPNRGVRLERVSDLPDRPLDERDSYRLLYLADTTVRKRAVDIETMFSSHTAGCNCLAVTAVSQYRIDRPAAGGRIGKQSQQSVSNLGAVKRLFIERLLSDTPD